MLQFSRVCVAVVLLLVAVWGEQEFVNHMENHGPKASHSKDGAHNEDYDHQAILGSEDLDDEFEDMPEAEARMRLEKMVDEHDTDKDGVITKEELTQWITESFKKLDREEAMEKFNEEDENQDGKVSWKEYLNKVYSMKSEDVDDMHNTAKDPTSDDALENNLELVSDDDDFFKAADVNNDGSLDSDEYQAFFFPPNHKHMHQVEMDHFMRDQDTDKDGKLSLEEFLPAEADAESRISQEENFKDLDKDKDGALTREEVLEWVVPKTDEMIDDEVKHLLSMADTNSDDRLSKQEILDKTKEFVGSSISNYGDFLHDEL